VSEVFRKVFSIFVLVYWFVIIISWKMHNKVQRRFCL
jgi:hypothetical protein